MSQRIDALRSVFSVNVRSSVSDKPGSGFAQAQSRQPGRVHLRAVSPPGPDVKQPSQTESISAPPDDRRMFRRRVERPALQPLGMSRQANAAKSGALVNDPAVDQIPSWFPELEPRDQAAVPVIEPEDILARPHVLENASSVYAEEEETYMVDRPVFLLSQKYFGTRY